jgi:hypothetical protein
LDNENADAAGHLAGQCLQYRELIQKDMRKRYLSNETESEYNNLIKVLSHLLDDLQTFYHTEIPESMKNNYCVVRLKC